METQSNIALQHSKRQSRSSPWGCCTAPHCWGCLSRGGCCGSSRASAEQAASEWTIVLVKVRKFIIVEVRCILEWFLYSDVYLPGRSSAPVPCHCLWDGRHAMPVPWFLDHRWALQTFLQNEAPLAPSRFQLHWKLGTVRQFLAPMYLVIDSENLNTPYESAWLLYNLFLKQTLTSVQSTWPIAS